MADEQQDYFKVFGVSRDASFEEIKETYKSLARRYHPDMGAGSDEERFKEIGIAFNELSDPQKRAQHEKKLQEREGREKRQREQEKRRRDRAPNAGTASTFGEGIRSAGFRPYVNYPFTGRSSPAPRSATKPAPPPTPPAAPELAGLLLIVAHAAPVGALVAQAGLQNPGEAVAIPIWIAGFSCGLTAWAIARWLVGDRSDWLGTYLDTPIPYLIVGFVLWLTFGFALYS